MLLSCFSVHSSTYRVPSNTCTFYIKLLGPVAARNVGDQLGHQSRSGVGVRLGAWDLRPVERLARVPLHPLQLQRTPPPSAERTPAAASLLSPTTRARVPCVCDPVLFFSAAFASSLPRREYTGHKKKVHTVAWSCTGTKVASGSVDQSVRIWTLNEGEPLSAPPSLPPHPPRHPRSSILSRPHPVTHTPIQTTTHAPSPPLYPPPTNPPPQARGRRLLSSRVTPNQWTNCAGIPSRQILPNFPACHTAFSHMSLPIFPTYQPDVISHFSLARRSC